MIKFLKNKQKSGTVLVPLDFAKNCIRKPDAASVTVEVGYSPSKSDVFFRRDTVTFIEEEFEKKGGFVTKKLSKAASNAIVQFYQKEIICQVLMFYVHI